MARSRNLSKRFRRKRKSLKKTSRYLNSKRKYLRGGSSVEKNEIPFTNATDFYNLINNKLKEYRFQIPFSEKELVQTTIGKKINRKMLNKKFLDKLTKLVNDNSFMIEGIKSKYEMINNQLKNNVKLKNNYNYDKDFTKLDNFLSTIYSHVQQLLEHTGGSERSRRQFGWNQSDEEWQEAENRRNARYEQMDREDFNQKLIILCGIIVLLLVIINNPPFGFEGDPSTLDIFYSIMCIIFLVFDSMLQIVFMVMADRGDITPFSMLPEPYALTRAFCTGRNLRWQLP